MQFAANLAAMAAVLTAGHGFLYPQQALAQVAAAEGSSSGKAPEGFLTRRQRHVADFVANVAGYDFDQCSAALHEPTSVYDDEVVDLLFDVGRGTGDFFVQPQRFLQVLSDRRVAKLYAWLQEMPADEAARRASALFDEKLEIHQAALLREVAVARGDEQPFEDGSEEARRQIHGCLGGNIHALSASLFLCASFCDPDVVLEKRDAWYQIIGPLQEEMLTDPRCSRLMVRHPERTLPEKLFLLNIYALTYDRHGCGPVERIVEAVGKRRAYAEPRFRQVWFGAWDTPGYSIVHSPPHDRVPGFDENSALAQFWIARRWGSLAQNEVRQDEVLAAARALVGACAPAPGER